MEFGKKKKILLTLIFVIATNLTIAQLLKINCENINFNKQDELFTVIESYIGKGLGKKVILLVDYMPKDSIDIFSVMESIYPFELFDKKPDCFFHYKDNLIYLYTEKYVDTKDTIWLNDVLFETIKFLGFSNVTINWFEDSIVSLEGFYKIPLVPLDCLPREYKMHNGYIIEQYLRKEMLYPQIGNHNGIKIIEDIINERRKKILEKNNHKYSDN